MPGHDHELFTNAKGECANLDMLFNINCPVTDPSMGFDFYVDK